MFHFTHYAILCSILYGLGSLVILCVCVGCYSFFWIPSTLEISTCR